MNTLDDYTPNPANTPSERLGATEEEGRASVRVPGGEQGSEEDHPADPATEPDAAAAEDTADEFDAYEETTGG